MGNKIKAIIKKPTDKIGSVKEIENTVKGIQMAVGGYFETITLKDDLCLLCDEERCDPCQHCGHTSEITHAKNFTLVGDAFFENTTGEDDPRILIISKMGDDIINKVEEMMRDCNISIKEEDNHG